MIQVPGIYGATLDIADAKIWEVIFSIRGPDGATKAAVAVPLREVRRMVARLNEVYGEDWDEAPRVTIPPGSMPTLEDGTPAIHHPRQRGERGW